MLFNEHIGGYRLAEQIGQGGMAVVFRALDERLDRQVALKILAPGLAADAAFRRRFIRESRAAAAVDDPHIIPVYEAGETDGVLFIAMRYVRGGDVRSLLSREGPLDPARVAAIISPVAAALDAAHAADLVHRDVKPANMLLDVWPGRPDHVYLSDFGLSKGALGSSGITQAGQFLGTIDYAAPEQITGATVDGQADQYALGCAAFEMLTGEPPFRHEEAMAVLYAQLSQSPPRLSSVNQGLCLPSSLDPVFARVLAKAPQDRYASCAEFSDALRDAAGLDRYDVRPRPGRPGTEAVPPPSHNPPGHNQPPGQNPPGPYIPGLYGPGPYAPVQSGPVTSKPAARRWPIVAVTAIVAAAAAAAIISIYALAGHSPTTADSSGTTSPAGKSHRTSTRPTVPATRTNTAPGPDWTTYHDPSGFSVKLPPGWAENSTTRTGSYPGVNFTDPASGFDLLISWSTNGTRQSALASWRQQAASFAKNDASYQPISLKQVTYRGYNAAVWEFTSIHQGVLTQVVDWGFVVKPGQLAYAIELYGPRANWPTVYGSTWSGFLSSFKPAY
jgi:serine/threonine protein kinase